MGIKITLEMYYRESVFFSYFQGKRVRHANSSSKNFDSNIGMLYRLQAESSSTTYLKTPLQHLYNHECLVILWWRATKKRSHISENEVLHLLGTHPIGS